MAHAVRLDTSGFPPARRLAAWQEIVCDAFVGLDCKSERADFQGALRQSWLGPISCTRVDSTGQRVFRTRARIARAKEDFVLFSLGTRGRGGVVQDGREAVSGPDELVCYDTTRPYELRFDAPFSQTIFQVPRHLVQQRMGATEPLTAVIVSSQRDLGRLCVDFLRELSGIIDRLDAAAAARLSEQALDLLAMAMAEQVPGEGGDFSSHRAGLLYRLKSHVRAHLGDPGLTLGRTAAALRISPRYVNLLLAAEGTSFGRYLLACRLERCRRDLADPACRRLPIGAIAYRWGFGDLSYFSRAFRGKFGLSPRDYRHLHGAEQA